MYISPFPVLYRLVCYDRIYANARNATETVDIHVSYARHECEARSLPDIYVK